MRKRPARGEAEGLRREGAGMDGTHETNRDRVRRLLLDPLGFRCPKKVDEADMRRRLDRVADDLSYLSDFSLKVLRDILATKGQGADRCFWPEHATFIGFAEIVQPRPIEELPALRSWFGSVEGPRAMADGTLVETFDYIFRRKAPPATPQGRAIVAEAAAANARRLRIIAERRRAELPVSQDETEWERSYLRRREEIAAMVQAERAARGKDDEA